MDNNKKIIMGCLSVCLLFGVCGFFYSEYKSNKVNELPKVSELLKSSDHVREELVDLYQQRISYLLEWEKSVQSLTKTMPKDLIVEVKIKNEKRPTLKSESDFDRLDMFQNDLSNTMTRYLSSKEAQKRRPAGLEKLEESINRKRHDYHMAAIAANTLIAKYDLQQSPVPMFAAERTLINQGLWR